MPAIIVIVSSRDERVARAVAVDRRDRAVVTGVHRLEHVERLAATDLTDDDAVGPHAQRVPDEVADRDLRPCPRCSAGRDSSRTTWGCCSWSSAASSIVRIRSSSGMNDDTHVQQSSSCPAPVPPATRMLSRPRTHASRNCATRRRHRAELDQVVGLVRVGGELSDRERRTVDRQRRDHGVHTRAVRQARVDVRRGLVDAAADLADDLVDRAAELLVVVELRAGPVELARPLDVDRVPVVDHDLGHFRVAHERLERPETQDAVADLPDDQQLLLRGERALLLVEELPQALVHQTLRARCRTSWRRTAAGRGTRRARSCTRPRTSEIRSFCWAFARRSASDMGMASLAGYVLDFRPKRRFFASRAAARTPRRVVASHAVRAREADGEVGDRLRRPRTRARRARRAGPCSARSGRAGSTGSSRRPGSSSRARRRMRRGRPSSPRGSRPRGTARAAGRSSAACRAPWTGASRRRRRGR